MARQGEGKRGVEGVQVVKGHGAEDLQGSQWTQWTILERAFTRSVLRKVSSNESELFRFFPSIFFNIDIVCFKII